MNSHLFIFGYETPEAESYNKRHGTDDEFSMAIFIQAEDAALAIEWGCEVADAYVKWLFKDSKKSWKQASFANWIDDAAEKLDEEELKKIPTVRYGEFPDFGKF